MKYTESYNYIVETKLIVPKLKRFLVYQISSEPMGM